MVVWDVIKIGWSDLRQRSGCRIGTLGRWGAFYCISDSGLLKITNWQCTRLLSLHLGYFVDDVQLCSANDVHCDIFHSSTCSLPVARPSWASRSTADDVDPGWGFRWLAAAVATSWSLFPSSGATWWTGGPGLVGGLHWLSRWSQLVQFRKSSMHLTEVFS